MCFQMYSRLSVFEDNLLIKFNNKLVQTKFDDCLTKSAEALCLRACRSPGQSTKQAIPNPNPLIQASGGGIYASPYPLHGSGPLRCWRSCRGRWVAKPL